MMKKSKLDFKNPFLLYTGLFLLIGFFVFFWFLYYGKSLLITSDGFEQYYPMLNRFRNLIKNLLAGKGFPFWSWEVSLGGDTIGNYIYFLTDPFFYIAALFPPEHSDIGYGFAIYLRLYFAGIMMMCFLRNRKFSGDRLVIGGLSYALSLWAISASIQAFFLVPLILFPLMVLGVDRLDNQNRPYVLIIGVTLSLITSVYFSYMSALMLALYTIVSFFSLSGEKNARRFLLRTVRLIGCVFVAVCISAPVMFPVLWTLMQASTESATDVPLLPLVTSVLRFIPTLITDGQVFGNYSAVSAGGLFAALIPAFVIDVWRGKNRLPVLMWGICLVFLLFPVFCSVFNGFSYPSARWCYMLTFFYIWAGVAVLDGEQFSRADFRLQYKWGFSAVFGLFILCLVIGGYFFKTQSIGGVTSAVVNLGIMYYAAQLLFQDSAANEHGWKKTQRRLLLLVILNLPCIYLIHFYPLNNGALNNYVDTDVSYQQYHTSTQRNIADIQREDTTFFRSDQGNFITLDGTITQFHWPANESVMYGTRTMTTYLSTLDSDVTDFYKAVCDNQNYMLRVIEYGNDNRSRLNYLTGVKYFTAKFDSVARYAGYGFAPWRTEDDVQILKNEYEPSLGYVYPEVIFNSRFGEYSYLDREQIMMQVAVVDDGYDGAAAETNPQSLQLDTEEISCEFQAGDGLIVENNTITVNKANAVLTLKPEPIENSEVYVLFDNFSRIPPSYEDKREQTLGEEPSKLQRDSFALGNLAYQSYGNFDIRVGANGINKRIVNQEGDSNQAVVGVVDYMSHVGYHEKLDGEITIQFVIPGTYHFDGIRVLAVSQKHFDEQARVLEANRLQVSKLRDNYVKGTVDSPGGLLYLSIPDNGGWSVWIDGEKAAKIYKVNIGFIGVDVPAGKHTVELRYRPFGFHATLVLCVVGCASFAGIVAFDLKKRKRKA